MALEWRRVVGEISEEETECSDRKFLGKGMDRPAYQYNRRREMRKNMRTMC
jgi:hypothetical protein